MTPTRYPTHTYAAAAGGEIDVEVELMNDAGEVALQTILQAPTVDEARALAEEMIVHATRDETWTTNETRPA